MVVTKYKLKYLFLGLIGGAIYIGIELLWRGYSHFTMFILGGICFICLGLINEVLTWGTPIWKQALIGSSIITALEFMTGCLVNLGLHWNVWDYSNVPCNILGQICLPYFLLWILISIIGIVLDDYIRYYFYNEEKPRYKLF